MAIAGQLDHPGGTMGGVAPVSGAGSSGKPVSGTGPLTKQFTGSSSTDNPVVKPTPSLDSAPQWDDDIKSALLELTRIAMREYEGPWKSHFREFIEAEEFWKGNHYPVWYERDFNWRRPFEFALENSRLEDMPTYQYSINIYQSLGLSAMAKLAERIPKVRWFPEQASSEVDLSTAQGASKVSAYIEDKNKVKLVAIREAYLGWTEGIFGTWTRYVRNKYKYGVTKEPQIGSSTVMVNPDQFICPDCSDVTPSNTTSSAFQTPECQNCGAQLDQTNYQAANYTDVPVIEGYTDVPNGGVKWSLYGGANICVMPYVHEFEDSGYLILQEEMSFAAVRSTWQDTADAIGPNESDAYGNTSDTDAYAKNARMRMMDAPQPFGNQRSYAGSAKSFSTVKRCWFRPWYLWAHPSKLLRDKLLQAFPDGCYVAFADGQFLEAENRNVDDEWDLCYPMPGQGLYRPPMGGSTIPLNKQLDDGANIIAEHLDFGSSPPMFFDAQLINPVAIQEQPMRPGVWIPVMRQNGGINKSLADLFHQPQFRLDPNIYGYGKSLLDMAQFVSGVIPSLFGGPLVGNDTASAYQQSSNSAMGKFLLFWQSVKAHHASVLTKSVKCFQQYETEDKEISITGESGDSIAQYIRLDEIQGHVVARPESDEDFPATMGEVRQNIIDLIQYVPAIAQEILSNPENSPLLKRVLASDEFEMRSEVQRRKTYREIGQLLQGAPTFAGMDPLEGEEQWIPSVPPDVFVDDHNIVIATIQEWARKYGNDVKKTNAPGYANVMARLLSEFDAMAAVNRKMAQVQIESTPPQLAHANAEMEQKQGAQADAQAAQDQQGPPSGGGQ